MTQLPEEGPTPHPVDIAIVGMACLFPGAGSVEAYWENIVGKVDAVGDPPPGWDHGGFFDPESVESQAFYCRRGGFLRELAAFDPMAYGVMPQSVDGAEPEHFLALRVAHEALADAGYGSRPFNREKAGVILGRGTYLNRGNVGALQHTLVLDQTVRVLKELHPEYGDAELLAVRERLKASLPPFNAEVAPGLVPNVMSGRIANRLDLKGPNFVVDAACASSLIAVDLGIRELTSRRCDLMLVGGVNVASPPVIMMGFCEIGALSRSQTIRPFDAEADGTLLGEGIGMVVLRRLADAQRDGDRVYAVIKGVGVASDGRALAVLAPRLEGEELALRRAYAAAGLSPDTVELIEAHGTATEVGDRTEIQALRRVFGDRVGRQARCALGTVKSMISHTIPAAGVAGLIKTALALYHKTLPPTLHCDNPNPKLELEKTPFYINTETRPWIHGGEIPRRAGVNAFGFGGINAHVILEEATVSGEAPAPGYNGTWDSEVVILSGESRAQVAAEGERLRTYLAAHPSARLRDVAFTMNTGGGDHAQRLAVVAASVQELDQKVAFALQRLAEPERQRIKDTSGIYFFEEPLARSGKLAFLFPGEGPQYPHMLADLCMHFPEVRAAFDHSDRVFLDNKRDYVPSQFIFPPPLDREAGDAPLWQIDLAVSSVFAANRGLTALLGHLGVAPDALVGHSSGEYAALLAAGAVRVGSDQELLRYGLDLNARYALFEEDIPAAVLVAVGAVRPTSIREVLAECAGPLYITMDNCPHQVVLCGTEASIGPAIEALRKRGAICNVLPFKRGYHTPLFAPVAAELSRFYQRVPFGPPATPIYSCATARLFPPEPDHIRDVVVAQWSGTVRFRETIEAMYADGVRIFVEVGPGGNLVGFVGDILKGRPSVAIPMNVAHRSGLTQLNHAIGLLAAHGVRMQLDHLYTRRAARRLELDGAAPAPTKRLMPVALALPTARLTAGGPDRGTRAARESKQSAPASSAPALPAQSLEPSPAGPATARPVPAQSTPAGAVQPGGPAGHETRSGVMAEYLRTMERFLEVEAEVVRGFLGAARGAASAPPSPAAPVVSGHPAGGPPAMEAPSPAPAPATPREAMPAPASPAAPDRSRDDIAARFLAVVSEKTGYPVDMLDPSASMEADLGIDSIKRVEILGAFQRQHGGMQHDDMERLAGLKTLQEVIDHVSGARPATVAAPSVSASPGPFMRKIRSLTPGRDVLVECTLDAREDLFLKDHVAIGRRPAVADASLPGVSVVPLSVSLEMMAEAAALVLPAKLLVGMKDVRVPQWFWIDDDRRTVVIHAKRERPASDEVTVSIRAEGASPVEEADVALMEGTVLFGDHYPSPPPSSALGIAGERPYHYSPERYYRDVMFHGPVFQGVASIDRCGTDGIEARLRSGRETGFFRSMPAAEALLLDPVLLDSAGQLVGFWTADRRERGFAVPVGFAALHLYRASTKPETPVGCRARVRMRDEGHVLADLECADAVGRPLARIVGWEDVWFDLPAAFTRFNLSRREGMLSESWPEAVQSLSDTRGLHCCRFRLTSLPDTLFDASSAVWLNVLARLVFSASEYDEWRALAGTLKRQTDWLFGRLAAKDAVRQLLLSRDEMTLSPADVRITADEHGAPVVSGTWVARGTVAPAITLAHSEGVAVAVAADCEPDEGIGIDVEVLRTMGADVVASSFDASERELLSALRPAAAREWTVRLWCAKEAIGKALGVGLVGGPKSVVVCAVDTQTGRVTTRLSGPLAAQYPDACEAEFIAYTLCEGDIVVGSAVARRSKKRAAHR